MTVDSWFRAIPDDNFFRFKCLHVIYRSRCSKFQELLIKWKRTNKSGQLVTTDVDDRCKRDWVDGRLPLGDKKNSKKWWSSSISPHWTVSSKRERRSTRRVFWSWEPCGRPVLSKGRGRGGAREYSTVSLAVSATHLFGDRLGNLNRPLNLEPRETTAPPSRQPWHRFVISFDVNDRVHWQIVSSFRGRRILTNRFSFPALSVREIASLILHRTGWTDSFRESASESEGQSAIKTIAVLNIVITVERRWAWRRRSS